MGLAGSLLDRWQQTWPERDRLRDHALLHLVDAHLFAERLDKLDSGSACAAAIAVVVVVVSRARD